MFLSDESKTAFTRCCHILKTVQNVMIVQFGLTFKRYGQNFKTIESSTVTNTAQFLQEFDAKEMDLDLTNRVASF